MTRTHMDDLQMLIGLDDKKLKKSYHYGNCEGKASIEIYPLLCCRLRLRFRSHMKASCWQAHYNLISLGRGSRMLRSCFGMNHNWGFGSSFWTQNSLQRHSTSWNWRRSSAVEWWMRLSRGFGRRPFLRKVCAILRGCFLFKSVQPYLHGPCRSRHSPRRYLNCTAAWYDYVLDEHFQDSPAVACTDTCANYSCNL